MLTAEARERVEHALEFSPERPRVTLRRDDLREVLTALDEGEETSDKLYSWGYDAGSAAEHARHAEGQAPEAIVAPLAGGTDSATKPWTQTAVEWFGIILIVVIAAYLGWLGGHGLL